MIPPPPPPTTATEPFSSEGIWADGALGGFVPVNALTGGLDAIDVQTADIVNPNAIWIDDTSAIVIYAWSGRKSFQDLLSRRTEPSPQFGRNVVTNGWPCSTRKAICPDDGRRRKRCVSDLPSCRASVRT